MISVKKIIKLINYFFIFLIPQVHYSCGYLTKEEFDRALMNCGFQTFANNEVYGILSSQTSDFSRQELAMFIAQLIFESGGFMYTEEIGHTNCNNCYHGRGYIQLTHPYNYEEASRDLGMGDYLLRYPNEVARIKTIAMSVSTWYWRKKVRPLLRRRPNWFGLTTKAINGGECLFNYNYAAKQRYLLYSRVAEALRLRSRALDRGCYN